MKLLKSHFWYNKRQRNGILFLIVVIITLQIIYVFVDFSSAKNQDVNSAELIKFQNEIDSLRALEITNNKPKVFPFNPNYISDFKGYQLGMNIDEIDRLHEFRNQNKFINSIKEFQDVTKISDSLLNAISPYFKFPDWVIKKNKQQKKSSAQITSINIVSPNKKISISTSDLNKATQQDFMTISGVGEVLASRIIKYRTKLQGYSFSSQLYEVWGLNKETATKVIKTFTIIKKPPIKKINVNTATFKELLKNPYIDYELCKKIFEYRDEVAELQNISELRNIKDFPLEKYDRIVIYLEAR